MYMPTRMYMQKHMLRRSSVARRCYHDVSVPKILAGTLESRAPGIKASEDCVICSAAVTDRNPQPVRCVSVRPDRNRMKNSIAG